MNVYKIDDNFEKDYFSVVQIIAYLADTMNLFIEAGRGSGKTTRILAPRIDRIQNSMPGGIGILSAATYKSIFENIMLGVLEYLSTNYERGIYYEVGKRPPEHFNPPEGIVDWKHTLSFCSGFVYQMASCDRPESFLGKNACHIVIDELVKVPEEKFVGNAIPALRADRSKFGDSPYFGGITGTSSTPDFETEESWWLKYERNMNWDIIAPIIEMAYEINKKMYLLELAKQEFDNKEVLKLEKFIKRWGERLDKFKSNNTTYIRASSLSNIKILGISYIDQQINMIKDHDRLNSAIFAVRKKKVGTKFWAKFEKKHTFDDSYKYNIIDTYTADMQIEDSCRHLKYLNLNKPLIAGFDPGPFMSIAFAQHSVENGVKRFRSLKNLWVIHPQQHEELAEKIDVFFKYQQKKEIFLHYDRAANQEDPHYRKFYPLASSDKDGDALLLKKALENRRWKVHLLSIGQGIIKHYLHYQLGLIIFGKHDPTIPEVLIDNNECDALVSSINHTPLKKTEGEIKMDKSAEKELPYEEQAYYSPQIASAWSYMVFGEFKKYLPQNKSPEYLQHDTFAV